MSFLLRSETFVNNFVIYTNKYVTIVHGAITFVKNRNKIYNNDICKNTS